MKTLIISGIIFYQKYISPHKGYCCAHRIVHGGDSCSEYTKNMVLEHGLIEGLGLFRNRIAECRNAFILYKNHSASTEGEIDKNTKKKTIRGCAEDIAVACTSPCF